jgi:urocanate hydratase
MPLEPLSPAAFAFVAQVENAFTGLMRFAVPQNESGQNESGLGGKLLYAGNLDESGRAFTAAAIIAGAAVLAAGADPAAARQAMRDGIVDFLVNSLDEALRILKNQVRKRETAAVCVGLAPAVVEAEMRERGVVPDLLRHQVPIASQHEALLFDECAYHETAPKTVPVLAVWRAGSGRPQDLAVLDQIALACLDADDRAARRWLRLAPRYLGRLAQDLRLLSMHREFVARFHRQLDARADRGEIAFPYEIRSYVRGAENKARSTRQP